MTKSKSEICNILPDVSPTTVDAVLGTMVRDNKIEIGKRIIKHFELSAISIVLNCSETEMLNDFRKDLLEN